LPNRETAIGQKRLPFCLSSSPDKQKTSSLNSPSALICANLRLSIFCLCLCALCVSAVRLFMSSLSVSICVHLRLIFPFRISIFHLQSSILGCILYCRCLLSSVFLLRFAPCALLSCCLLHTACCLSLLLNVDHLAGRESRCGKDLPLEKDPPAFFNGVIAPLIESIRGGTTGRCNERQQTQPLFHLAVDCT